MNDISHGPRLSLRQLLLLLVGIGVTAGLLGRWFFRSPAWFLAAVVLLTIVLPYLMAALTLVSVGTQEKRGRVKCLGYWLILGPVICTPVLLFAPRFLDTSPGGFKNLSTSVILSQRLPNEVDQPWVWDELKKRLSEGKLTSPETDIAIGVLAKHMSTTKPKGWNQPLSWQDDFIKDAFASNAVSPATQVQLYDAFFRLEPRIETRGRPRAGQRAIKLNLFLSANTWANNSGIPVRVVWWPKEIRWGGSPVRFSEKHPSASQGLFGGSASEQSYRNLELQLPRPLSAGTLKLEIVFDFAYVEAKKLVGLGSGSVDSTAWPKSVKRWEESRSVEVAVAPAEGAPLALSTAPTHDPSRTGAVRVGRAVLQSAAAGKSRLVLPEFRLTPEPIPLAFKIEAIIGGQRVPLGAMGVAGNQTSSRGSRDAELPTPGADVVTLDLLLTPEPKMLEDRVEVNQIWGKPVELRGLPLERLDLEAAEQAGAPASAE